MFDPQELYIQYSGWTPERETDSQLRLFWERLRQERDFEIRRSVAKLPTSAISRASDIIYDEYGQKLRRGYIYSLVESIVRSYEKDKPNEKIAKFLAKHLKDSAGYKMSAHVKGLVGQILTKPEGSEVRIRFSLGCAGDAEDYYHEDSCYWGSYAASRDYIEYNDGGAVRLYQDGWLSGRAWFLPYSDESLVNGLIMFNFYGSNGFHASYEWGDLISEALHVDQHDVRFWLDYRGDPEFFLNNGTCIFIGRVAERLPYRREFPVKIMTPDYWDYAEDVTYCDYCERYVGGNYEYIDGYGTVCDRCLDDSFHYIYGWGYVHDDRAVYVDGQYYHEDDDRITYYDGDFVLSEEIVIDEKGDEHHTSERGYTWDYLPDGSVWPMECLQRNKHGEYELK